MMDILKRPVLYNVITIVALILSVIALLDQGRTLIAETSEIITRLEGVAAESDPAVGEAAVAIRAGQEARGELYRQSLIAMIIAIVANVIANYRSPILAGSGSTADVDAGVALAGYLDRAGLRV